MLRRGNAHTAEGMLRFLKRVLELAPRLAYVFDLRLDAEMTGGRVLDYLTRAEADFSPREAVLDALCLIAGMSSGMGASNPLLDLRLPVD